MITVGLIAMERMTHELLGQLAIRKETFKENPISILQLGELIDMVQNGNITGRKPSGASLYVDLYLFNH